MKIRELAVECYGILTDTSMVLEGEGLHVLYGPNEAGKSTLLQLIRDTLFGFPQRSPYVFTEHAGEMAVTATLELANGDRLKYRRRKGRTNEVVGENLTTSTSFDKGALQASLGHASPELFQHVFGFSLKELASGEESLRDARLSEALYGGALGGLAGFQSVLGDLTKEHEQLYLPSATKRTINLLLGQIKSQQTAIRSAQLRPREYESLENAARDSARRAEELRQLRDARQRELERGRRLLQAVTCWLRRREVAAELEGWTLPPLFPPNALEQYTAITSQRERLLAEQAECQLELDRLQQDLAGLKPRQELLERTAAIQRLAQQLDKIRGFRADIGQREQESRLIQERVATLMRDLDPAWTPRDLERFHTSLARRSSVDEMQRQKEALENQWRDLHALRPNLVADVETMQQRLTDVATLLVPAQLERLAEEAAAWPAHEKRLEDLLAAQAESVARCRALEAKLRTGFARHLSDLAVLSVPLASAVSEFRQQLGDLDQTRVRRTLAVERAAQDLTQRREDRAALDAESEVPDSTHLAAVRARRDEGWQMVRQQFVDGQPLDEAVCQAWLGTENRSLPDAYEASVQAADQVADQRQRHAETVASQEQLAAEIARLERRLERETQQQAAACSEFDQCWQAWQTLWKPCGVEPASPDVMLEWLRNHEAFLAASTQGAILADQVSRQQAALDDLQQAVIREIGDAGLAANDCLAELRRRVARGQAADHERRTLEAELPVKLRQLARLDHDSAEIQRAQDAWQHQWLEHLEEFGFPRTWSPTTAGRVLSNLREASQEQAQVASLDRRVQDMRAGLETFDQEVQALCVAVDDSLLPLLAEDAVVELHARLEQTRKEDVKQQMLRQELKRQQRRDQDLTKRLEQSAADLAQLLALSEVDSENQFLELAQRAPHWHQLREEQRQCDQLLQTVRGDEDPETFVEALSSADAAELESKLTVLQSELEKADSEFNEALQQRGAAAASLRGLDRDSRAAQLAQELESTRSQLRDAVDQWATLTLARHFMQRAMQRFEREHQPRLLQDVAALLQRMTLGRYVGLARKLDEQGTLQVRQADGTVKEPHQLSTGTREQLYLAIRLAYVLHYCREAEPLPIVMDDVLVNFDERRATATLEVLVELARQLQVILLTCHPNTIERVRHWLPDLRPILLRE